MNEQQISFLRTATVDRVRELISQGYITWQDAKPHLNPAVRSVLTSSYEVSPQQLFDNAFAALGPAVSSNWTDSPQGEDMLKKLSAFVNHFSTDALFNGNPNFIAAKEALSKMEAQKLRAAEAKTKRASFEAELAQVKAYGTADMQGLQAFADKWKDTFADDPDYLAVKALFQSSQRSQFSAEAAQALALAQQPFSPDIFSQINAFLARWEHLFPDDPTLLNVKTALANMQASQGLYIRAAQAWNAIDHGNISAVNDFVKTQSPDHPCMHEAQQTLGALKQNKLNEIREKGPGYSRKDFLLLLDKKIFSEQELIDANVASPRSLELLRNAVNIPENAMHNTIASCTVGSEPGATDVYLWGTPNTGLMGLVSCYRVSLDSTNYGGPYGQLIQTLYDCGLTAPGTSGDFVCSLQANIFDVDKRGRTTNEKKVNLVEMSGETFLTKVAYGDSKLSLADMGNKVADLLKNRNRKIFLMVLDPSVKYVDNKIGIPVAQHKVIERMLDLMSKPENEKTMELVDAVHIVISKVNLIGQTKAEISQELSGLFSQTGTYNLVWQKILGLTRQYKNINKRYDDHKPQIYQHTLGKFWPGGVFEANSESSDKLAEDIKSNIR